MILQSRNPVTFSPPTGSMIRAESLTKEYL
jgi:hypothetical protein